jgi:4-hydroxy-tetrahydrodipicolinate reductase
MTATKPLRVVQWATGNVGTRSLCRVIEHPDMALVGLYVSSPSKLGLDAARLVERDIGYQGSCPDTGVIATNSLAEIVALKADCVLYMRQGTDIDELCALLEAGSNIVTTRGDFHHPPSMDPALRARIEAACHKGGTSIYSQGCSPGWITESMLLTLSAMQRRIDCITIDEFADMTSRDSPDMVFNIMGYGVAPGAFDQAKLDYIKHDFAGSLNQTADALGLSFDDVTVIGEMATANNDTQIAAGLIPKGTVAALRITVSGLRSGKPVLRFRANWYCTRDIDRDWALRDSGWRVVVEGDAPLDVSITYPVSEEDYPSMTPGLTAHPAVNAVHTVCAAPPGIRTTADLPRVIGRFD